MSSDKKRKERMRELVRKLKAAVFDRVAGPLFDSIRELESMLDEQEPAPRKRAKTVKKCPTLGSRLLGRYRSGLGGFGAVSPPISGGRY